MKNVEERRWTTSAGLQAVVIMMGMGYRCGYVEIPEGHPLHGKEYADYDYGLNVHGGVTFSGPRDHEDSWWYGFDCAHYGDAPSQEARRRMDLPMDPYATHRSLDYCVSNCESLAAQIQLVGL